MAQHLSPVRAALCFCLLLAAALCLPANAPAAAAAGHHGTKAKGAHRAAEKRRQAHRRALRRHRHQLRRISRLHRRSRSRSVSNAVALTSKSHPSGGDLLFSGSQASDFWVDHSAPGAIGEVPDPAGSGEEVISTTVHNDDVYPITPTENPRAELLSPPVVQPGDEIWLATKFLVPDDYPKVPDGGWVSLVSFYGAPFEGPSPWHLELAGEKLQWQRNGTYGYDVPWETPLARGRWTDVLVHERFASEGFIEMWIDGQQVQFFEGDTYNPSHVAPTDHLDMATMDASNDAGANSAKIMQYREAGMFESGTIYFGALKLGTTRAAVES